ncbi:hypothetical protein G6F42_029082 [Rhizopus arrhizus]|nr:hypothetical protein G6F42_029082 [Rhizopus arrhizus]
MSTRSALQEVKTTDVDELETGQVTESLDKAVILVVDDKRTTTLSVTTVTELTLASTELAGVGDLDNIRSQRQQEEPLQSFQHGAHEP